MVFATSNLAMFVIQILYLTVAPEKEGHVRMAITVLTTCLFLVDAAMIVVFLLTTFKFTALLDPEGKQNRVRILQRCFLLLVATWMMVRGASENLFRTGSLMLDWFDGDSLDIALWANKPNGSNRKLNSFLTVAQNTFTLAIGLCILGVYYQLGRSRLQPSDSEAAPRSGDSSLNVSLCSQVKLTSLTKEMLEGKRTQILVQRSLLVQMHQKNASLMKNKSDRSEEFSFIE